MPTVYALDGLPKSYNATIKLSNIPVRLMATWSYSGAWSGGRYRKSQQQLLEAVLTAGLKTPGSPLFARYIAQFSLCFLRRNKVLIEVEAQVIKECVERTKILLTPGAYVTN